MIPMPKVLISTVGIFRKPVFLLLLSACLLSGCAAAPSGAVSENAYTASIQESTQEIPEETTAPAQPQIDWGNFGPVEYEMTRWDRSDRSLNKTGHHNALVYVEYPVFSGDAAVGPINKSVYQIAENFLNTYTEEEIHQEHYAFGIPYAFSHEGFFTITHNGGGILSVSLGYSGFWGEGNYYNGSRSYVYRLDSGKQLTAAELTGMDPEFLLELFHRTALEDPHYAAITEESRAYIDNLTLEEYSFGVSEGQIFINVDSLFNNHSDRISIGGFTGLYLP